jgi:hypothetical protein
MNEEVEYVVKTQCGFCKYKKDSPRCMNQEKGKCSYFTSTAQNDNKATKTPDLHVKSTAQ